MTESFEHYASKYYDPVKAHEYYMKTRHLKGYDTQGKTLNDEGKQAKAYFQKKYIEFAQKTRSDYSKTLDSEINKLYSDASMTKAVQTKKKV